MARGKSRRGSPLHENQRFQPARDARPADEGSGTPSADADEKDEKLQAGDRSRWVEEDRSGGERLPSRRSRREDEQGEDYGRFKLNEERFADDRARLDDDFGSDLDDLGPHQASLRGEESSGEYRQTRGRQASPRSSSGHRRSVGTSQRDHRRGGGKKGGQSHWGEE